MTVRVNKSCTENTHTVALGDYNWMLSVNLELFNLYQTWFEDNGAFGVSKAVRSYTQTTS